MKRRITLAISLFIFTTTGAAAGPLDMLKTKPVDLTFLDRLNTDQVPFVSTPIIFTPPKHQGPDSPETIGGEVMKRHAEAVLARLLANHPGPHPDHIDFVVTTDSEINCATVISTGQIGCTSATLEQLFGEGPPRDTDIGEDELAFLLAHELGHRMIAGHGDRFAKSDKTKAEMAQLGMMTALALDVALSKRTSVGNSITITATPAATSAFTSAYFGGVYAGDAVSGLASPAWSQKEEDEADQYAFFLMKKAGYDIGAAQQLFGTMEQRVRDNTIRHDSVAKLVATKAAQAAMVQALFGRGMWEIGLSGLLGGASAMEQVNANHYHRDLGEREERCHSIAEHMSPKPGPEQLAAANAARRAHKIAAPILLAASQPVAAPPVMPKGRARKPSKVGAKGTAYATILPTPPSLTPWQQAVQASRDEFLEVDISHDVIETLSKKGVKDAIALCPANPKTSLLAMSCGLALAGDHQYDAAEILFKKSLTDTNASARVYHNISLARANMNKNSEALSTLDQGDVRFPGGQFYADRITIMAESGDKDGATKAAERCLRDADPEYQKSCKTLALQLKLNLNTV